MSTATRENNSATTIKGIALGRRDTFMVDPNALVVVTDPSHPLYDERVSLDLDEGMVKSVMEHGILFNVLIRRNGDLFEVMDGRQRVRAAIEANKRLEASGSDKRIQVPVTTRRDDDQVSARVMVAANEIRQQDSPLVRARKAQRLIDQGQTEEDVARQFGMGISGLKGLLRVLETSAEVQQMVDKGQLPVTAASTLSALPRDEQKKAMEELRSQGLTITRKTTAAKVKAKQEAKRSGKAEEDVQVPPRKKLVSQVADAYDAVGKTEMYHLLVWVLTGRYGTKIQGPYKGQDKTLAAFIRELEEPKAKSAKGEG